MYKISNARTCENNSKMFYFYVQYLFATLHRISFIRSSVRDFLSGSLNFHPIKSFKIFILYYTILIFIFIFFWDNPIRIYIYIPRPFIFNLYRLRKTRRETLKYSTKNWTIDFFTIHLKPTVFYLRCDSIFKTIAFYFGKSLSPISKIWMPAKR